MRSTLMQVPVEQGALPARVADVDPPPKQSVRAKSAPSARVANLEVLPLLKQPSPETGVQTERDPGQIPGDCGMGEGCGLELVSSEAARWSNAVNGDQACPDAASELKDFKRKTLRDEAGSGSIKPSSEIGYAASAADLAEQPSAASNTPVPSPMGQQKVAQSASVNLAGQSGTAPVANTSSSPTGRSDAKPKKGLFGCCMPRRRSRGEVQ